MNQTKIYADTPVPYALETLAAAEMIEINTPLAAEGAEL